MFLKTAVVLHTTLKKEAQLIVRVSVKGEPIVYQCSLCDQAFPLCEHGTAKESMAKIWVEFRDHVRQYHLEDVSEPEAL